MWFNRRRRVSVMPPLTEHEYTVLDMIARGYTRKEIANELGISINSVRPAIERVYAKIGARGIADACRWYYQHGGKL